MNNPPMTAKEYLSQAYRIDQRINAKLEQAERLRELVGAEQWLRRRRVSHSRNIHRMEDGRAPDRSGARARPRIRRLPRRQAGIYAPDHPLVADADCRLLLELRYLSMKRWEDIAGGMQIMPHQRLLHRRALDMVETILTERRCCAP